MSHATLGPTGITGRTESHRSQLMTLWVTRQDQEFVTTNDLQLCDVELVNASVELVGEPGYGDVGLINTGYDPAGTTDALKYKGYKSSMNLLHGVNNSGAVSNVYGYDQPNKIYLRSELNHGHCNVSIQGMTESHQFRQDSQQKGNMIDLMIPTDMGLIESRIVNNTWPSTPIVLEAVHMEQRLRVHTSFAGIAPAVNRVARFTQDWADSLAVQQSDPPTITRNDDGSVRYFINNDEGQSSTTECQVPANCIDAMKLVFRIRPRTTL